MILDEFENFRFPYDGCFNASLHNKLKVMLHATFLTQKADYFLRKILLRNALQNLQQLASLKTLSVQCNINCVISRSV